MQQQLQESVLDQCDRALWERADTSRPARNRMPMRTQVIWARCEQSPRYFCVVCREGLLGGIELYRLAEHVFLDVCARAASPMGDFPPLTVISTLPVGLYWGQRRADAAALALRYWTVGRLRIALMGEEMDTLVHMVPAPLGRALSDRLLESFTPQELAGPPYSDLTVNTLALTPLDSPRRPWRAGTPEACARAYHAILLQAREGAAGGGFPQALPCCMLDEMRYCDASVLEELGRLLGAPAPEAVFDVSLIGLQVAACAEARGLDTSGWAACWEEVNACLWRWFEDISAAHVLLIRALPPRAAAMVQELYRGVGFSDAEQACRCLLHCPSAVLQLPAEAVTEIFGRASPAATYDPDARGGHLEYGMRVYLDLDERVCLMARVPALRGFSWWVLRAREVCPLGVVCGLHAYAVLRVYYEQPDLARELWPSLFRNPGNVGIFLGQFEAGFLGYAFRGGVGSRWALSRGAESVRGGGR